MGTQWLKNFLGIRQTDFELLRVPNPGAEFCIHVTLRSIQTGALLGSVMGPIAALAFRGNGQEPPNRKGLVDAVLDGGRNGALIGACIGPALTWYALRDMSSMQLYDKCYRLRFDSDQLWLDRTCVLSATTGLLSNGSAGLVIGLDLSFLFHNIASRAWGK